MAKRRRKIPKNLSQILYVADVLDVTCERLTGKTALEWVKELKKPRELPPGVPAAPIPPMPLVDAYVFLGLPQTATMEEVNRNYKRLAAIYHPDKGGYAEAMVILNNAYERIKKEKKGK